MIGELVSAAFYLFENTFDGVSVSVGDVLKSEAMAVEYGVEPGCAVNEEFGVVNVVFLFEFTEEDRGSPGIIRGK
jgi:hypothetical protein